MEKASGTFQQLRDSLAESIDEHRLGDESISISARSLSPAEAIGNPEADDYPILKGKERMMQATFRDARGQAFSDMCGEWTGKICEVMEMKLDNNFRRAVFVASLNALMGHLGLVERTVHCRDDGPVRCAKQCPEMLSINHPSDRIGMIGYQPRMVEVLSGCFKLSVVDMDRDNIGKQVCGITVLGPDKTSQVIDDADLLLVTGTTLVNGTIEEFLDTKKKTVFYGVTIAGAAELLGLQRFCPYGL